MQLNLKVSDIVVDGLWLWPPEIWCKYGYVLQQYMPCLTADRCDKVRWKSTGGSIIDFSVGAVWNDMYMHSELVPWSKLVWFSQGVPRHAFVLWLAIKEKLRTMDRLAYWNMVDDSICVLCHDGIESHNHLFVDCMYTMEVWRCLEGFSGVYGKIQVLKGTPNSWSELVLWLSSSPINNSIWSIIHRLLLAIVIYFIWQERNNRLHSDNCRSVEQLSKQICELIKMKLMGLNVKSNENVKRAAVVWGLGFENGEFTCNSNFNDQN
ncbi:uncharacterized protein LOC112504316 [Cynara cardunculus var. scolymus]|uniref:uncharacterized protein LOC112504316 n=1 Tax=Cynara cardunculus var. scolymus TaxID=59895 RepID=UPI000D62C942|nr:uncharacterized protein LOC112504316 [Cynara cardunculus var. scolymus]